MCGLCRFKIPLILHESRGFGQFFRFLPTNGGSRVFSGTVHGTFRQNRCGDCAAHDSTGCTQDCSGDYKSVDDAARAFVDDCGQCSRRRDCHSAAPPFPLSQAFQQGWRGVVSKLTAPPTARPVRGQQQLRGLHRCRGRHQLF